MPLVLAAIWLMHYGNRGWLFPLSIRQVPGKRGSFNIVVLAFGMVITTMHGYLNGAFFSHDYKHLYSADWLTDPRFSSGWSCTSADSSCWSGRSRSFGTSATRRTRAQPSTRSRTAEALFVTSPAYLGELIAWAGFALLTWSLAGVIIFLITAGNLVPRAFATHKWYQEKFPDYPPERKALIPGLI